MYGNAQNQAMLAQGMNSSALTVTPEIAREHLRLRDSVEELGGVVSALHEKLRPVVLQRPQAVANGPSTKEQDCYSELGQSINAATCGINGHAERLRDLLQSLAV